MGEFSEFQYCVTAVDHEGRESLPSNVVKQTTFGNWEVGDRIRMTWNAVAGAEYYIVYCARYGLFGRIGETEDLVFVDDNILPDFTGGGVPREREINPENTNEYPSTLVAHNQRMMYANSILEPYRLWGTRPGEYNNLNTNKPIAADSAMDWSIASNRIDQIEHLLSWRKQLLLFTSGGVWVAMGDDGPLSATDFDISPNLGVGCSPVPPIDVGDTLIFTGLHRDVVYDMTYSLDAEGYSEVDRSIHADHLFKNRRILEWTYQRRPYSVIWAVTDRGDLLGLTYVPSQTEGQGVWAWHHHETKGEVESVCVVKEDDEDIVYFSVKRVIDGAEVRYIERMYPRDFDDLYHDGVFMDSSLSADFVHGRTTTAEKHLAGLDHLEGEEVVIVADGQVVESKTVVNGELFFTVAADHIHVGLPYTCQLEPLNYMGKATSKGFVAAQGTSKRPVKVNFYLERSIGFHVGADLNSLYATPTLTEAGTLYTGEMKMNLAGAWQGDASLVVQHVDPLPLSILSIYPTYEVGS